MAGPPLAQRAATSPAPLVAKLTDASPVVPRRPDASASLFPPVSASTASHAQRISVPGPTATLDTLRSSAAALPAVTQAEASSTQPALGSTHLSSAAVPVAATSEGSDLATGKPAAAFSSSSALFPALGADAGPPRKSAALPVPITSASTSSLFPPLAAAVAITSSAASPDPSAGALDTASASVAAATDVPASAAALDRRNAAVAQPTSDAPGSLAVADTSSAPTTSQPPSVMPPPFRAKRVREPSLADTLFPALSVPASIGTTPLGSQALSDASLLFPPAPPTTSVAELPKAPSTAQADALSLFPPAGRLSSPGAAADRSLGLLPADVSDSAAGAHVQSSAGAPVTSTTDVQHAVKPPGAALDSLFPPVGSRMAPVATALQSSPLASPRSAPSSPRNPPSGPPSPTQGPGALGAEGAAVSAPPPSFKRKRFGAASDSGAKLGGMRGDRQDTAQRVGAGSAAAACSTRITPPASPRSPLHWRGSSAERGSSMEAPSRPTSRASTPRGGRGHSGAGSGQGASVRGGAGRGAAAQHGRRAGQRGGSEERGQGFGGDKGGRKRRRAGKGWSAPHGSGMPAGGLPPPPPLPSLQNWRFTQGGCGSGCAQATIVRQLLSCPSGALPARSSSVES